MSKPPFTNIHVGLKTGGRPCLHEKKIMFGTSVTVTKDNLMEVVSEGFINILKEKGCKIVLYIEYVPADGVDVENAFDDPERLLMEQKLNELRNTYKDIIFISFQGMKKDFSPASIPEAACCSGRKQTSKKSSVRMIR